MVMIDISLKDQPIKNPEAYTPVDTPAVLFGAVIRDEFDNQRLTPEDGVRYKHQTGDLYEDTDRKTTYYIGVKLEQPLIGFKILNDVQNAGNVSTDANNEIDIDADTPWIRYEQILNNYNMSADKCIHMLRVGCLPINGKYLDLMTDHDDMTVLRYNFSENQWYNQFAALNMYILF